MNTNSPPPPNSVELPAGIPLSLSMPATPTEARLHALIQFYELGKTPADVEVATALRELIRLRSRPNEGMREALEAAISTFEQQIVRYFPRGTSGEQNRTRWIESLRALALPAAVAPGEKPRDAMTDWRNGENMAVQNLRGKSFDGINPIARAGLDAHFKEAIAARDAAAPIEQARGEEQHKYLIERLRRLAGNTPGSAMTINDAIKALSAPSLEDARRVATCCTCDNGTGDPDETNHCRKCGGLYL